MGRWPAGVWPVPERGDRLGQQRRRRVLGLEDSPVDQLKLRPPTTGSISGAAFATAIARQPTLDVAYALSGASFAYDGENLAVVGKSASGALEARQFVEMYPEGFSLAVSPDGRWVITGSSSIRLGPGGQGGGVGHVQSWQVDGTTAKLTDGKVITLIDDPVALIFR
jgi:hypothetical protein